MTTHLLPIVVLLPLAGAFGLRFMSGASVAATRSTAAVIAAAGVALAFSIWLRLDPAAVGWQFAERPPWTSAYLIGVDVLRTRLILLTALFGFVAVCAATRLFGRSSRRYASLLVLQGAIAGAYMALSLPVFVLCWVLMLLSIYTLVRPWVGAPGTSVRVFGLCMAAATIVLILGTVVTELKRGVVQPTSSCDTPPAPAPPSRGQADAPPDFLTFAACSDDAKAGKRRSRGERQCGQVMRRG